MYFHFYCSYEFKKTNRHDLSGNSDSLIVNTVCAEHNFENDISLYIRSSCSEGKNNIYFLISDRYSLTFFPIPTIIGRPYLSTDATYLKR